MAETKINANQTNITAADIGAVANKTTMPTASSSEVGNIYQYVGTTDANYTNGYFYKCSGAPRSATASQTNGSGLSDIAVNIDTFETQITTSGSYAFQYDEFESSWTFGGNNVNLADYGITYSGTAQDWDIITVVYSAGGYAWSRVDVQPAPVIPDPLPSQTGQSGKFLTTDGTDASWSDKPLVNTATATDSLTILGTANTTRINSINIGAESSCGQTYAVCIGYDAHTGANAVAVGSGAKALAVGGIGIGYKAQATTLYAIQIGGGVNGYLNADRGTVKFGVENGNYEIMSADGTIPEARLADTTNAAQGQVLTLDSNLNAVWGAASGGQTIQYSSFPTATSSLDGTIGQYTGTTDANYTNGYFYKCQEIVVPASATASQTTGSSLTDITVEVSTFETAATAYNIDLTQPATFVYDLMEYTWLYGSTEVGSDLGLLGVNFSGTESDGDAITVVYTPSSSDYGWVQQNTQPANFVQKTGDTMSGSLKFVNTVEDMHGAIYGYHDGVKFGSVGQDGTTVTTVGHWSGTYGIVPGTDSTQGLGASSRKWATVYTTKINNGADITIPTNSGTMLINDTSANNSITIRSSSESTGNSVTAIGYHCTVTQNGATAFGAYASANGTNATAIGGGSVVQANNGVAIGCGAKVTANGAIMINTQQTSGWIVNPDANTFKVANANGNFEIMDANGNLPADRLASTTGLADGNYRLRLVMASGVPTLEWVSE